MAQVAEAAAVPMMMQIWKHRRTGTEVRVVWATQGKVGYDICLGCTDCKTRCDPAVDTQVDFANAYAYLRAF